MIQRRERWNADQGISIFLANQKILAFPYLCVTVHGLARLVPVTDHTSNPSPIIAMTINAIWV